MASLFSFLRSEGDLPEGSNSDDLPLGELEFHTAGSEFPPNNASTPAEALALIIEILSHFLPDHDDSDPWPAPTVAAIEVNPQPLAIGNRRGTNNPASFSAVALTGGRLNAVIRFQLWHSDMGEVDAQTGILQTALLEQTDELWRAGVLRLNAVGSAPAEHVPSLDVWRKTADYRLLYEYHHQDTEGAHSLIARIPIHAHTDQEDELTLVTDEMTRWDNETAPTLTLRGPQVIRRLSVLAFTPAPTPGNTITLRRTFDGAIGDPINFATLPDFFSGITAAGDPVRHGEIVFATVTDFLDALTPIGSPLALGDWDEDLIPDLYQPYLVAISPPLHLFNVAERLDLICEGDIFDASAVGYAQAKG